MDSCSFHPQPTGDGSFTFFSAEFGESFHSHYGAMQEATYKFVLPCLLPEKARSTEHLTLLDVCYGLGYNTAAALAAIWQVNPDCRVTVVALEWDERVPKSAIAHHLLDGWPIPVADLLQQLADQHYVETDYLTAQLDLGDARQTLLPLAEKPLQADAIFLDPFSPPHCPQLWTVEFIQALVQCLHPQGRLATYSCAAAVRQALRLAGLHIGTTPGIGRKSPGTIASFSPYALQPLSQQEQEHLHTRAAIPYRDRTLNASQTTILQTRQREQKQSLLEPTTHWKKRWQSF
ncbi:MnmC family methyltransferase [Spirulina sp. CS-785/01]|uniref:tRNA (5-methylaminomethyl-2-thiouridine)(34)-methyltransferase MnmD n=1 Tax=Spirulina sp. CS-785/01 TaxID=3021716 RepID=UPI00232D0933|nr:MnmC family methyltransferase [Spirulina sp. CS-785/01]MDB9314461.1 MnmC family methyltransferase [Spirulina sp. CS-785/01]